MAEVEARTVLWYMTFMGFIVNYMIRINLNITIVDMIAGKGEAVPLNQSSLDLVNASDFASLPDDSERFSLERWFLDWANIGYDREGFHWNEKQQGALLGSFFWAHWTLQIPGGILATKYGTKLIFGWSNGIGVFCCFLIPIVSYWSYTGLICLRVFQGWITGLAWPSMHVLTAKWIPPNERSKFVSAYLGSSVGVALFYPIFGYIIDWTSWEWVYYICGVVGTLWFIAWQFLVYDTPAEHPRIADSERRYIEKSLGASVQSSNKGPTPWMAIATSRPVWLNVVAQWGGIWGLFTLMTHAPTYFRLIHHWNIRATGFLSGLPHLMRMIFAYTFSILADYLLRTDRLSRTNVRKLATFVCCGVKGLVVLALAYFGYNAMAAILLVTLATMFHGAVSSGPLASMVDLSPNYAGIVLGVSGMIGGMPGFISPLIVGHLTQGNQTIEAWKKVFLLSSAMLTGSGILYVLFSESTLQPWNSGCHALPDAGLKELQTLEARLEDEEEKKPLNRSDADHVTTEAEAETETETETKTKSIQL
ncbi:GL10654 [Drosophila persimilis]|uniref:GL10654 n=1 Tax=Drosophila persimilis TaxID=7234 RepID=B4GAT4_DROPE|nr:sialin [Drosophila persimilis]EDW32036.1 GL10654 [Drosophila persimilis]